jgi:LacI family transcriptional regulator/LacI family repressor for deo operon, udp, cdd, tsx, nupC, and nupG
LIISKIISVNVYNINMSSLKDVASKAGVSIATVSRVINDAQNISDETRFRVQQAMKALSYRPSRIAKRLRSKSVAGNLVGVMVPDISNPFYIDVLTGIEDYMHSHNYLLIMCNFSQNEQREQLYLDALVSESVDGLIVAPAHEEDEKIRALEKDNIPFVCIDRGLKNVNADLVLVENEEGAYRAVRFLAEQGYRNIAYISGLLQIPTSRQREAGYQRALQESNIPIQEDLVKYGDSSRKSGVELARELLIQDNRPDALFTGNNLITLGALETINEMGLKIPEDIAIIGFDDMPWSSTLNPPLTAVRQPAYEIGRRAAELLYQRILEPGRPNVKIVLDTKLMIRKSTRLANVNSETTNWNNKL